jgi:DNA repair exonuclease SbcCD ATPase subunit
LVNDGQQEDDEGMAIDKQEMGDALETAQDVLKSQLASTVRETRERATRATEVELDEYRQYVRQRRDELADKIDRLTMRIEEVTETIDSASEQERRVEALRERKKLRTELNELRSELDNLTSQIESDFPEKRREIRERHALTVRLRPVTATAVSYERGDLDLTLRAGETTISRTYGYAVGTGVIEDATCDRCEQQLSAENPLKLEGTRAIGTSCCDD